MMNFKNKYQVCGRFNLVVRKAETNEIVRETGWFDNLVLNQGLDNMATKAWFVSCKVGTGNSTPIETQTQLDAYAAISTTVQANSDGATSASPYYRWRRKTFRFNAGVFNNVNLAEVAIGYNTTANGTGIWNRALIKDATGTPTTLTVLSDETLDIVCEIRVYQSEVDQIQAFNLYDKLGNLVSSHTAKVRAMSITLGARLLGDESFVSGSTSVYGIHSLGLVRAYSGSIGSIASSPSTFAGSASQSSVKEYIANSYSITVQTTYSLNTSNGVISALSTHAVGAHERFGCSYQVEITPPITKTSSQTLTLNNTISWGRYIP